MFTYIDLLGLSDYVAAAWDRGVDRDWSARAGTLEWSCTKTADHAYDAVLAVGFFLASRRQDRYPEWGGPMTVGDPPWPSQLVEAIAVAGRLVAGVVATTPDDVDAIIWRRPEPTVAAASEFAPRAALEMMLHGHDVAAGLGVPYEPPEGLCSRLRGHTCDWPHWASPGWKRLRRTGDAWGDLLDASGRARFAAVLEHRHLTGLWDTPSGQNLFVQREALHRRRFAGGVPAHHRRRFRAEAHAALGRDLCR